MLPGHPHRVVVASLIFAGGESVAMPKRAGNAKVTIQGIELLRIGSSMHCYYILYKCNNRSGRCVKFLKVRLARHCPCYAEPQCTQNWHEKVIQKWVETFANVLAHLTTELSTPVMHIGALLTVSAFHIFYALKVFGSHNLQLFEIWLQHDYSMGSIANELVQVLK
jgi:hypothetical protein